MDLLLLIIAILFGFLLGVVSGLTPGIHVNNLALLLLGIAPLAPLPLPYIAVLILSNYIAHTFFDIVPSVFIGAPDEETALAVLPGHRLLLEGRGIEAIKLSATGSALSVPISLTMMPVLSILFIHLYASVESMTPHILIAILIFMVFMEREEEIPGQGSFSFSRQRRRLFAILSISLSGLLGTFAFRYQDIFTPLIPIPSSFLFPLLTGLFGAPIIAQSIRNKPQIPEQDKREIAMKKKNIFKNSFIGSLSGSLVSWLPGVSSGVATVLARYFVRGESEEFIISLSSVNTSNALYNLLFFYLLGISRSGAINGVKSLLGFISLDWFLIFLAVAVLISLFSYIALLHLSPSLSLIFTRLNYTTLNISILIFLFGMILLFTGINGILLFLLSFFVGSALQKLGVKRTNAMSCIMIPIILMRFNII